MRIWSRPWFCYALYRRYGLDSISLNNFNLDEDNFDYCDHPETINHVRLVGWYNKFEQRKAISVVFKQQDGGIGAC